MSSPNFARMMQLAEEVFDARNDPDQLDVNENVISRLQQMHPASVTEFADENGPVVWILLIPTTVELMERFLDGSISEKQLFDLTPVGATYETIYLCSAMVLEEYRRKGLTKRLSIEAIEKIRASHPIKALFVWAFTDEGNVSAQSIANAVSLPLCHRSE